MSKKLMLLAAGALSALAFAALPAIASAQEMEAHCPVAPCVGQIVGSNAEHPIRLENDNGERIEATGGVDGTIKIEQATSKTFSIHLEFTHVVELISGFKFTCNSPGAAPGVITVPNTIGHFVTVNNKPAALITNVNVTFTCAAFLTKTVTGNIIGTITEANCGVAAATNKVTFNISGAVKGTQEHELYTGVNYDLISGTQSADTTTSAQTGHGNITWQAGNKPTLTCL